MLKEIEANIGSWLPVMIELEKMEYDPVKIMFQGPTMETIEALYVAQTRACQKNPQWAAVIKKTIADAHICC